MRGQSPLAGSTLVVQVLVVPVADAELNGVLDRTVPRRLRPLASPESPTPLMRRVTKMVETRRPPSPFHGALPPACAGIAFCAGVKPDASTAVPGLHHHPHATRSQCAQPPVIRLTRARLVSVRRTSTKDTFGPSDPFEDSRGSLPAADAHRNHAVARLAALHFPQDRGRELGAGAAQRMAERDGAAVDDSRVPDRARPRG